MAMIDKVNSAIAIKADIKAAIEAKGVSMASVTFGGYATKIGEIPTGIDPTSANATRANVRSGKTFYAGNSVMKTGTMPDSVVTQSGGVTSVTSGYLSSAVVVSGGGNYTNTLVALENISSGMHAQFVSHGGNSSRSIESTATGNEIYISGGELSIAGDVNALTMEGGVVNDGGRVRFARISGGNFAATGGELEEVYLYGGTLTVGQGCFANDIELHINDYDGMLVVESGAVARRVRWYNEPYAGELTVSSGGSATVIIENPISGLPVLPTYDGTVEYVVNISDADATPADVVAGKTFYSGNNPIRQTGTASAGMPAIPASFTTLDINTPYTATGDGWIKYRIKYVWGDGTRSYLSIGSRTYGITTSGGEVEDYGNIYMEGIAPVYSGETFEMTTEGSAEFNSYIAVAYI